MPDFFNIPPFSVFIGLAALVVGVAFYLRWRRRKGLQELAAAMGLLYTVEGPDQAALEATGLEIFRQGRSRKAKNLIQTAGSGGKILVFDYSYVTGGGKNSNSHGFTLALIECGSCPVPVFDLKPESFIYKIGEMVGFKDIDMPAFPVFSDKYRLTAPDEAAVHMFFTPSRAAWFERNLGLSVQGARGYAVLFKRPGELPVSAWQPFLEEAKIFAAEVLR